VDFMGSCGLWWSIVCLLSLVFNVVSMTYILMKLVDFLWLLSFLGGGVLGKVFFGVKNGRNYLSKFIATTRSLMPTHPVLIFVLVAPLKSTKIHQLYNLLYKEGSS
jgi:hypothetical protein